ncbi:MAG: acyl-CoA synthetase [Proteobacteria bacterium]|nr:acyl-CoA synthetase [Pseudomonadota bacterium]
MHKYNKDLEKNSANYVSLSPISFLFRAAEVYPERVAIIYNSHTETWADVYQKACGLASSLQELGVAKGDTVAVMAANTPEMYHCHFGVPMTGAVLNTLNTRLDSNSIAYMLKHGEAKVLIADTAFSKTIGEAVSLLHDPPIIVDIIDLNEMGERLSQITYDEFIVPEKIHKTWSLPEDEWNAIALSYTSGTTGSPKGVVTHHRGAYLNAISNVVTWEMSHFPVYLWTLPMFHCNGWCFPWTLAALAGTSVCLRNIEINALFGLIEKHKVTHYCGAPVVHNMILNAPESLKKGLKHDLNAMVAGASPPTSLIEEAEKMGINLTHVYGLTEVYGPAAVCAKQPHWEEVSNTEKAKLNGRQGVRYVLQDAMDVLDTKTLDPVPRDGKTLGEIMFRGNITMKGYLKNASATKQAFEGGWFHTGDLAIIDPDGYVKIKDRSKDIIISGGENISTIEIEDVLYSHAGIFEAAVVAKSDEKWGEVPCAFVTLKQSSEEISEKQVIDFCRERMAHFKCPKYVIFGELPKTSTGKIQKNVLRQRVR